MTSRRPRSELERILEFFVSDQDSCDALQSIDPTLIPGLTFTCFVQYEGVPIVPVVVISIHLIKTKLF